MYSTSKENIDNDLSSTFSFSFLTSHDETNDNLLELSYSKISNSTSSIELPKSSNEIHSQAKELIRSVTSDEFIEGEISKTQLRIEKMASDNPLTFCSVFQKTYLTLFKGDSKHLYTLIGICSNIDYEFLEDSADAILIAGFAHSDIAVKEATIRAIESWENKNLINYIENMEPFNIEWLENYRLAVIQDLENL